MKLEDIARLSGVSRSTVSRVINQQPNVSEPVRLRVWKVIEETGYYPHQAARSLASQRSSILGLVIPRSVQGFFADPYFPCLTQGVAQACNEQNNTLALFVFHTKEDERQLFARLSRPGLVDGVIIQATHADDVLFNQLIQSDIPFVVAGRPVNVPDVNYVDVDNVQGAYTAVRHLVHLGYRRIGTITGPLNTTTGMDRLKGYQKALEESNIDYDESFVVEGDFSQGGGYYWARRLLTRSLDAMFIASDMMAIGALRALQENEKRIPEDIAIVAFDDVPDAARANPPLTTIRQPIHQMGMRLVQTLLDVIDNGSKPPRKVIFGTELVIRESCNANRAVE